jgi:hypothetical protein
MKTDEGPLLFPPECTAIELLSFFPVLLSGVRGSYTCEPAGVKSTGNTTINSNTPSKAPSAQTKQTQVKQERTVKLNETKLRKAELEEVKRNAEMVKIRYNRWQESNPMPSGRKAREDWEKEKKVWDGKMKAALATFTK